MTTFHEPPLQSRRVVREAERADATPSASRQAPLGEPLNYVTQNRPLLPGYDAVPRGRRVADPPVRSDSDDTDQSAAPFRVRDYSPEGRRSAPAWAPSHGQADGGVVDYHTQARAAVPRAEAGEAETAGSGTADDAAEDSASEVPLEENAPTRDISEHTLTRRELRAIREAHGIVAVPTADTPVVDDAVDADAASPDTDAQTTDAQTAPRPRGRRAADVEPDQVPTGRDGGAAHTGAHSTTAADPVELVELIEPDAPVETPAESSVSPAATPSFESLFTPSSPSVAAPEPSASFVPPVSASDSSTSRLIGSGAITTNALVLPSLPGQDISTGEILVTGSIDLPRSLSSTGAHPSQLDESDLDHLLDPGDHQVVSTDSVPIRAAHAISSHTATRGVMGATKPRGNRALTALIISAAGMAVVVATLLVVALATNVL
jgi:hypothetical protein